MKQAKPMNWIEIFLLAFYSKADKETEIYQESTWITLEMTTGD